MPLRIYVLETFEVSDYECPTDVPTCCTSACRQNLACELHETSVSVI